ncbi:Wd40 repeat [Mycena venus]|uniref:Wd40 repeat n=1 Tax=Mycena venus TaxID=2733690 RepID=A0A8H7CM78_9AGAR|nr:Wd40 repeat [Mycena venus]
MDNVAVHQNMVLMCIGCMNTLLCQDIYGLSGTASSSQISKADMRAAVPDGLQYACLHWVAHLVLLSPSDIGKIADTLQTFVREHLLHWLECLVLIDGVNVAMPLLERAIKFVELCQFPDLQALLQDIRYIIPQVSKFVRNHPLRLYSSALDWLPETSQLRKMYAQRSGRVLGGLDQTLAIAPSETYPDPCGCVCFSPDGRYVVSANNEHKIEMWDVAKRWVEIEFRAHDSWIMSLAFSPDGARIVAGYHDHTIGVWSVATRAIEHILVGHSSVVLSARFSPDGKLIVSGSHDKTIRVWNVETGVAKLQLQGHDGWIMSAVFSPDGTKIASGSGDCTVRIWSVDTGEQLFVFAGHSGGVYSVAFSPGGMHVASGSDDHTIGIWPLAPDISPRRLLGHSGGVFAVSFSPNGRYICSASGDTSVGMWNFSTGELLRNEKTRYSNRVHSAEFSRDGHFMLSACDDRTLLVSEVSTGEILLDTYNASVPIASVTMKPSAIETHSSEVKCVVFSSDGNFVASGSSDKTIRVWSMATGRTVWVLRGHSWHVTVLAFSPDGLHLASACPSHRDFTVRLWSLGTGMNAHVLDLEDNGSPSSLTFSPDGKQLLVGTTKGYVRRVDIATAATLGFWCSHPYPSTYIRLVSVALAPDGQRIAGGFSDGSVVIYNLEGEQQHFLAGPREIPSPVESLIFSLSGLDLLWCAGTGLVKIWTIETGTLDEMSGLGFKVLPDGTRIACAYPGHFQISNMAQDQDKLICTLSEGDGGPVFSLASAENPSIESLQIWLDYQRDISMRAFHGTRACLGYWSGRVILLDLARGEPRLSV